MEFAEYTIDYFLKQYNIPYNDLKLYEIAFTHSSYANENGVTSNERLEFLGDSVLNLIISEYIYKMYPNFNEGILSQMKSYIICSESLIEVGERLKIPSYMRVSKGFKNNSLKNKKVLEDCFESILGALFIDLGLEYVKTFAISHLKQRIEYSEGLHKTTNYKTTFQEIIQKKYHCNPEYRTISKPDRAIKSCVGVYVNNQIFGIGWGDNIKLASINAAKNALSGLKSQGIEIDIK